MSVYQILQFKHRLEIDQKILVSCTSQNFSKSQAPSQNFYYKSTWDSESTIISELVDSFPLRSHYQKIKFPARKTQLLVASFHSVLFPSPFSHDSCEGKDSTAIQRVQHKEDIFRRSSNIYFELSGDFSVKRRYNGALKKKKWSCS